MQTEDSKGSKRLGVLSASLRRRPLMRLTLSVGIALLTLGLIYIYSQKWHESYREPDHKPDHRPDHRPFLEAHHKGVSSQQAPSLGPAVPPGIPPPLTPAQKLEKNKPYWEKMTK